MSEDTKSIVNAIHDLARVVIAMTPEAGSRADVIRRLSDLGVPASRIGAILDMQTKDVTSVLAKAAKRREKAAGKKTNSTGDEHGGLEA